MILVKFFVRIARFLRAKDKKEQISNLLRKISDLLIHSIIMNEPEWIAHCWSFVMSDLSDSLPHSQSLFWHERPERFAHSRSFVLSDLSESLTVTHLIWAIWANKQMSKFPNLLKMSDVSKSLRSLTKNEQPWAICSGCSPKMSEWANSQPCSKWSKAHSKL